MNQTVMQGDQHQEDTTKLSDKRGIGAALYQCECASVFNFNAPGIFPERAHALREAFLQVANDVLGKSPLFSENIDIEDVESGHFELPQGVSIKSQNTAIHNAYIKELKDELQKEPLKKQLKPESRSTQYTIG